MKKNAQNKLKLDKKTVSKLNAVEAVEINGGKDTLYRPTIINSCFCPTPPVLTAFLEVM
jgi:hypothetical protein